MAVGHLTYLDLSPEQRREGAKVQREQLRQLLANPFLTKDQHKALMERMTLIDKWEKGDLDVVPPVVKKAVPNALRAMPQPAALLPASVEEKPPPSEDVEVSWDEPEAAKDTPRVPVHHEVKLTEEVPVKEEISSVKPKGSKRQ